VSEKKKAEAEIKRLGPDLRQQLVNALADFVYRSEVREERDKKLRKI
jgi:hypothetical protein